jgi:S1-C subfamily serine protease
VKKFFAFVTLLFFSATAQANKPNSTFINAPKSTCKPFIESNHDAVVKVHGVSELDNNGTISYSNYDCSGVVISAHAVYTAKHCVSLRDNSMTVLTFLPAKKATYYVKRVEIDASSDLAILHVDRDFEDIKPAPTHFMDMPMNEIDVGELIGFGCDGTRLVREVIFWREDVLFENRIFMKACVCHGDSGGGVFDTSGNLIGIISTTDENGSSGAARMLNKNLRLKSS